MFLAACSGAPPAPTGALAGADAARPEVQRRLKAADAPRLVKDVWAGKRRISPASRLYHVGALAYFVGGEGEARCGLWRTDGTDAGTKLLWSFPNQQACWDISWIIPAGDRLVFRTAAQELYSVQGDTLTLLTRACNGPDCGAVDPGTQLHTSIQAPHVWGDARCDEELCGHMSHFGRSAVRSGRHAIWRSYDGSSVALWSTDGVKVQKIMPDADDLWLIQRGDEALMWRCDGKSPCGLWRLDPTGDKPKLIARAPFKEAVEARSDYRYKGKQCLMLMVPSGPDSRSGQYWCEQGGKLVKGAPEGYRAALLDDSTVFEAMTDWYATARVTLGGQRVLAAAALNQPDTLHMLVRRGRDVGYVDPPRERDGLFILPGGVEDPEDEAGGWRPLGPSLIPSHGAPQLLAPLDDGRVIFFARDDLHGLEPWVMAADGSGAALLADLQQGEPSSLPTSIDTHGDVVCFTLATEARHCTDGTPRGTRKLPTPRSWPLSGGVVTLEAVMPGWTLRDARGAALMSWEAPEMFDEEGELTFPGGGPEDSIWRAEEARQLPLIRVWRGRLYAVVGGGEDMEPQVLVTDGTAAGTRSLAAGNIEAWGGEPMTIHAEHSPQRFSPPSYMPASPGFGVDAGGRVSWVMREDGQDVRWATDGTPANTKPSPEEGMFLLRGEAMITVQRPGDAAPVQLTPLPEGGRVEALGQRGGLLWFMVLDDDNMVTLGLTKATLWVTDGTLEGTRELKAPAPIMAEPWPVLTNAGLVFSMDHVEYGRELFLWPVVPR